MIMSTWDKLMIFSQLRDVSVRAKSNQFEDGVTNTNSNLFDFPNI